jgi:hypothetical protein
VHRATRICSPLFFTVMLLMPNRHIETLLDAPAVRGRLHYCEAFTTGYWPMPNTICSGCGA